MVTLTLKYIMAWDEDTLIPQVKSMFCFNKAGIAEEKVSVTETSNTFIIPDVYELVLRLLQQCN